MLEHFNVSVENRMKCFCDNYDLKNLIKQPTCHKFYAHKIATQFLQYTSVRDGLPDFHLMTLTVMGKFYKFYTPCVKRRIFEATECLFSINTSLRQQ